MFFRTPIRLRFVSLSLVAFMLVASGRGLVPRLCLTLSAVSVECGADASCATAQTDACCATENEPKQEQRDNAPAKCPLCHIVHAVFQTSAAIHAPVPPITSAVISSWRDAHVPNCSRATTRYGRAPPKLLALT